MAIFRRNSKGPETGRLRRFFSGDKRGSVAIEFAMLIIPFSMLTFAILESCVSFAASQLLANGTDNIARQLRTGQLKKADITEDIIRAKLCAQIQIIVSKDCPGLKFDLRQVNTFKEAADLKVVFNGSGQERELASTNFTFKPGVSMTKNTLRVFYEWPVITNFISASLANLKGGKVLHYSSVTWQNEPFTD
jgi:Flp pilus assembly protein TadG